MVEDTFGILIGLAIIAIALCLVRIIHRRRGEDTEE